MFFLGHGVLFRFDLWNLILSLKDVVQKSAGFYLIHNNTYTKLRIICDDSDKQY